MFSTSFLLSRRISSGDPRASRLSRWLLAVHDNIDALPLPPPPLLLLTAAGDSFAPFFFGVNAFLSADPIAPIEDRVLGLLDADAVVLPPPPKSLGATLDDTNDARLLLSVGD